MTRDYLLELDRDGAPLLNIFDGKRTTYRKLAEEAMTRCSPALSLRARAWTATGPPLPGGERKDIDTLQQELRVRHAWVPESVMWRLVYGYGTCCTKILGRAACEQDLDERFGVGRYPAEVDYLRRHEWVLDSTDLLWRRSKLGR